MKKIYLLIGCHLLAINLLSVGYLQAQTCLAIPLATPSSQFTVNGNGTVTHLKTGLTWMKCSLGQTWNGSTCTGSITIQDWQAALVSAENTSFAGFSDWRLPNLKELTSINELACAYPSINETLFPATSTLFYWSSSSAISSDEVWIVSFGNSNAIQDPKSISLPARLVRGGL